MPIYEYECSCCDHHFDRRQSFDEEPISTCPLCGGKTRRVLHSVPVMFKGSGFYVNDYGRGANWHREQAKEDGDGKKEERKAAASEEKKEEKKTEAKAEKKAEKKTEAAT